MEEERIIDPLLYIDQPKMMKPKAYMQETYSGINKTDLPEEVIEVSDEEIMNENDEGTFKQLSLEQKINYLINLPSEVLRLKCEVITDTKTYRGTIKKEDKETVTLKVLGQGDQIIDKEQVKDIQLIGF